MKFRIFVSGAAALAAAACVPALHAQVTATAPASVVNGIDTERFDFLGAAAYSHFNPGYAHQVRAINLLGWQAGATAWFTNLLGFEGTVRGLYGSYTLPNNAYNLPATSNMSEYLFLFGPSFRLLAKPHYTAGMHVLIGGTYGTFNQGYAGSGIQPAQIGVYDSQLASAYAIGGWGDYKVSQLGSRFAIRFTADYQPTRYASIGQNEFFGSVGIVYKLGQR